MRERPDWTCSHCGTANKGFSQVCLACSREKGKIATRGVVLSAVAALAVGVGLAVLLVYTFRSPRLESEMAGRREEAPLAPATPPPAAEAPPSTVAALPPRLAYVHSPATPPPPPLAAPGKLDPIRDPRYLLRLREKRVNELRSRIAAARTPDERQTLSVWLDGALRDLSDARRQAQF